MKDYRFTTEEPLATTADTMAAFMNNDEHFYSKFDKGAEVIFEDGSYAEVQNADGKIFEVHAAGDGDFVSHRITFNFLRTNQKP